MKMYAYLWRGLVHNNRTNVKVTNTGSSHEPVHQQRRYLIRHIDVLTTRVRERRACSGGGDQESCRHTKERKSAFPNRQCSHLRDDNENGMRISRDNMVQLLFKSALHTVDLEHPDHATSHGEVWRRRRREWIGRGGPTLAENQSHTNPR